VFSRVSPASRLVLAAILLALVVVVAAGSQGGPRPPGHLPTSAAPLTAGPATAAPGPTSVALATASAPDRVSPAATQGSGSGPGPTSSPGSTAPPTPRSTDQSDTQGGNALISLISQLPVAAERREGYSRELFRIWIDADGDGCDTRHEVLIDEAVQAPHVGSGCRLTGGSWISPYDGVAVSDASKLDIDHLVPLAEAWDSGASAWTAQRREAFANDLGVPWALFAVTASSNRSKGDQDPADWLPPLASDRCTYVVDWVAVKVRWGLSVDATERQALLQDAAGCDGTPIPSIPTR
jgi:Protein of unknown function (DUF1524)